MNSDASLQLAQRVVRHYGSWAAAREQAERQDDGTLLIRLPQQADAPEPTRHAVKGAVVAGSA